MRELSIPQIVYNKLSNYFVFHSVVHFHSLANFKMSNSQTFMFVSIC